MPNEADWDRLLEASGGAVLPDLLSELGHTVVSRPSVGTRQYGVDVAAVGPRDTIERR